VNGKPKRLWYKSRWMILFWISLPFIVISCCDIAVRWMDNSGIARLVRPNESQEPTAKDQTPFSALKGDYEQAQNGWNSRYHGDLTIDQSIERYDSWPGWSFVARFVELGTADANRPYAFDALKSVVELSQAVGAADSAFFSHDERAFSELRTKHLSNPRIIEVFEDCARYPTPAREALLRECVRHGEKRDTRGLACLALAECLRTEWQIPSHWLDQGQTDPFQEHVTDRCSPQFIAFTRSIDPDGVMVEAKAMYQQSADEYGDISYPKDVPFLLGKPTLSQVVKFRTAQLDAVSIGQQAPDIVGEDLQGQKRSLSDYQGKIVVLHFWATWCGPCVEKIPHLQRLVSEHETQPFSMLGVNLDRDREAARKFVSERGLSWPSWSALTLNESMGRWRVDGAPLLTVMVLDQTGVIRYEGIEGDALDKAIESLLLEGVKTKK
jgi:thiol-disulfide isomerase/thioredoxin